MIFIAAGVVRSRFPVSRRHENIARTLSRACKFLHEYVRVQLIREVSRPGEGTTWPVQQECSIVRSRVVACTIHKTYDDLDRNQCTKHSDSACKKKKKWQKVISKIDSTNKRLLE